MKLYIDKLKQIRKSKKLNIGDLAELLEISRNTLSEWERAVRIPSERKIRKIAEVLNISPSEISDIKVETKKSTQNLTSRKIVHDDVYNKDINNIRASLNNLEAEVEENKLLLDSFKNNTTSIVSIKNKNLRYVLVNKAFEDIFNLKSSKEIIQDTDEKIYTAKETNANELEDNRVLETGEGVSYEGYIPGTRKKEWGIISKQPIMDAQNLVLGLITNITVITDDKQNKIKNNILLNFLNSLEFGVSIKSYKPNNTIFINNYYQNLYGYDIDFFSNKDFWLSCVHEDDKKIAKEYNSTKSWPKEFTFKIVTKDSSIKHIRQHSHTVIIDNTKYYMFIEEDITEELKLKAQTERILSSINEMGDCVSIIPRGSTIKNNNPFVYISSSAERLFGMSVAKIEKRPLKLFKNIINEDKPKVQRMLNSNKFPNEVEFRYNHPTDGEKWIRCRSRYNTQGFFYSTIYDITDIKLSLIKIGDFVAI